MKKITRLLAAFLFISFNSLAQQIDVPLAGNADNVSTIPIGPQGVVLLAQVSKGTYTLTRFDTSFQRLWGVEGTLTEGLQFVNYSFDGHSLYLLFSRDRSSVYEVVKVLLEPGFLEKYQIQSADRMEISAFQAYNDGVYLAGVVRDQPILSYTNLQTRQNRLLNASFAGAAEVQALEVDTLSRRVNATYSVRRGRDYSLVVKSFDADGRQITEIVVTPDADYALLDGRLTSLSDSTQVMIGSYGYKNLQSTSKGRQAQGLYICRVTPQQVLPLQYYSFTDFRNYFGYLSPRDQEKRQEQVQRRKEKGSDLKLNSNVLVHDIMEQNGQLVMVAESFVPTFRSNSNYGYGGFGTPFGMSGLSPWGYGLYSMNPFWFGNRSFYGNNQQQFDGYQYSHAIVAGFDKAGRLLWDDSFPLDKTKTMSLNEKVKASQTPEGIRLLFSDQGRVRALAVQPAGLSEAQGSESILTQRPADRNRRAGSENMQYWYDNHFLAWHVQRSGGRAATISLKKIPF